MSEENLPQSDIDALLAAMRQEATKQRRLNRFTKLCRVTQLSLLAFVLFCGVALHSHNIGSFIGLVNLIVWIPGIILNRMNNGRRKNTVFILTTMNDIRIVGPLCDALGFGDAGMAKIAQETLIEILPRLQSTDAHLLNNEQRRELYKTLLTNNRLLILATLTALEQIGDEKALPIVEQLASSEPLTQNRLGVRKKALRIANLEIREAAQNCLPFLRERAAAQKASQELLRASSPDTNIADLLRPASSQTTAPQELLRASVSNAE